MEYEMENETENETENEMERHGNEKKEMYWVRV
jgi:hypothetical protein